MYAWVHVCMYACVSACMCVCIYVCMYACMYACMYVFMHECVQFRVYICHSLSGVPGMHALVSAVTALEHVTSHPMSDSVNRKAKRSNTELASHVQHTYTHLLAFGGSIPVENTNF